VSATLGEAFYFEQPRVTVPGEAPSSRSTSDVIAELEVDAFQHWNARAGYVWDPSSLQTQRGVLGLQYKLAGDSVLNASWRYQRDLLQQVDLSGAWPIANNLHAYGRWVYSISEHKALDEFVGFQYSTCCWAVRAITRHFLSSRTGQSSTTVGLELELKGLSSVGAASESFLRDAIRGYSALPSDAHQ
jgi:LPS-assembly protein